MSKHVISTEALNGFESSTTIASHYGSSVRKLLVIYSWIGAASSELKSEFRVVNRDIIVLKTRNLSEAINEYNKY